MAGTDRSKKTAYLVVAVVVAISVGELVWSHHRAEAWSRERALLSAKADKFDSFCDQQRVFLGVIRDQLQSGSASWLDVSMTEFKDVFIDQLGQRDLIACLGSAAWDDERAKGCSAQEDPKCMIEIANQTITLLSASKLSTK
jgi:hypothetical protein